MNFTWWMWLIMGVCIVVTLLSIRWYRNIPTGYENEAGFHEGTPTEGDIK